MSPIDFNVIFNVAFLSLFIYHVLYFLVQYYVFRRNELFFYSMFLLSASLYYYLFVIPIVINISLIPEIKTLFSPFEMSFSFIQTYFYIKFIITYLGITKNKKRIFTFFKIYKYYNLIFFFLFLSLGVFHIENKNFLALVSAFEIPLLGYSLFLLRKMYSTYSNIVILGTAFTIAGTIISLLFMNYAMYTHIKLSFNEYMPAQVGLIFDLFILGYGLSLKAAESDKKLVNYLLENQQFVEIERSRLAQDLHDGLGGMLSGIKLNLSSINGNLILPEKDANLFSKSIKQLENVIGEMRRIAHNMMPEALHKFGLNEAIQDYYNGLDEGSEMTMKFIWIGPQKLIEKSTEVSLFRIIQELTNNAVKHSAAKNIFTQINKHDRGITLTVEDDGSGFNYEQNKNYKGAGLKNVKSRVDHLKGTLEIQTSSNNGTYISIEIPC